MSAYQFTNEERYAVFTVHSEKCYLCGQPIDLLSMQVDHIIPEHLEKEPEKLAAVLKQFGLPGDFNLNTFANWLPACMPCNNRKKGRVFDPVPIIQVQLQIAAEKAARAGALAAEVVHTQTVTKAVNTLQRARTAGKLTGAIMAELRPLLAFHVTKREPEVEKAPLRLAPDLTVEMKVVRGPYGTGMGLFGPGVSDAMRCGSCGSTAFNGARCVMCGEMDD